jgi:hypothetical protein
MLSLLTCLTASCDQCGRFYECDADEGGAPAHFVDETQAVSCLDEDSGWRQQAGGVLTCQQCVAKQDCATYGHDWGPCRCAGRNPNHAVDRPGGCTYQLRWCDRCSSSLEQRQHPARPGEARRHPDPASTPQSDQRW